MNSLSSALARRGAIKMPPFKDKYRVIALSSVMLAGTVPTFAADQDEQIQTLEQRIKTLEENNTRMETALDSDRLSDKDPEVVARLKAIESRTLSMQKQARTIESLEGITAGASLVMVAQNTNDSAVAAGGAGRGLQLPAQVFGSL